MEYSDDVIMPSEPYVSDADKRASNPTFTQDPYMF